MLTITAIAPTSSTSSLSGIVYDDANNDGIRQSEEPGAAGVSLTLVGTDTHGHAVTRNVSTAVDGSYFISGLPTGEYSILETLPSGSIDGKITAGTALGTVNHRSITGISLGAGVQATGYNFAYDRPPTFLDTATPDPAVADQFYTYQAEATDSDGDPLTYSLLAGPTNLQVTSSGLVTWTPSSSSTPSDVGTHLFSLEVSDGRGGTDAQNYTITVYPAGTEFSPHFTSTPIVDAAVLTPYTYLATATEPGLDPSHLTFSIVSGPTAPAGAPASATMTLTQVGQAPGTALITWTPVAGQVGDNQVALQVSDDHNRTAPQTFTIYVRPTPGNTPPVIVSDPITTATPNTQYRDPVVAVDSDDKPLTYTLLDYPAGMHIDQTNGVITWTPDPSVSGQSYNVTVQVTDIFGASDQKSYTVTVSDTNAITGRVFSDVLQTGAPQGIIMEPTTTGITPLHFVVVPPPFDGIMDLAYHQPDNTLLASVNSDQYTPYTPVAFEEIQADGSHVSFSDAAKFGDEVHLTSVQPGQSGGWSAGDVFAGTGTPGEILKISDNGKTVLNP
ncbi:MAG TPA: putative Ig domain-containing protein, partial [Isosphaeraceae bacterium]|nr:putative Ig domain-containing protein [Isosphaeraceae bacterium]